MIAMFWTTLITYIVIFLVFCVLGFCGVMIGKKLRDKKEAKTPAKIPEEESK